MKSFLYSLLVLWYYSKAKKNKLPQARLILHVPLPRKGVPQMAVEVVRSGNLYHVFEYFEAEDLASELAVHTYGSLMTAVKIKEALGLWVPDYTLNNIVAARSRLSFVDKINDQTHHIEFSAAQPVRTNRYLKELGRPSIKEMYTNPPPLTVAEG